MGAALARALWPGARVGLDGGLGAGKTAFVRGLVSALEGGVTAPVASPTFALCLQYRTVPAVAHLDAWRLESLDDLESIGFWEIDGTAIVVIEWASRLPGSALGLDFSVTLEAVGELSRRIAITARTARAADALAASEFFSGEARRTDGRSLRR